MDASFEFPTAKANDASDVVLALETAKALWRQGDSREALRWLRRAAEGAESEGDDMRAVALARAAADLQDRLPQTSSMPAPAPTPSRPPSPPSRQPPPLSPSATPPPARVSAPPPPSQRAAANTGGLEPWTPPGPRPPPAPERSSPRASGPPPLPPSELASSPTRSKPPPLAPAEPSTPLAAAAPVAEPVTPATPAPVAPEQSAARSTQESGLPMPHAALRVSVELLSKKSGTLLVRLLGENDGPAGNAHEALLVPLDPSVDLRKL